jgi:hypothetical protein
MKRLQPLRKQSVTAKPVLSVSRELFRKSSSKPGVALQARNYHPAEEDLEEFLFGRLPERQRQLIETHLHDCDSCRESLVDSADIVSLLRMAMGVHELCASWPESWESPTGLRLVISSRGSVK